MSTESPAVSSSRLPVVALVGRPNVGKSTLFNMLTRTRDAIVADLPGLTRDRIYGYSRMGGRASLVVDTGGLTQEAGGMAEVIARQTALAIAEADIVLLILDARGGLVDEDRQIVKRLRKSGKPLFAVANKSEGLDAAVAGADFYALGLGEPFAISAAHGDRVEQLMQRIFETLPESQFADEEAPKEQGIRIAVVGRPNAGKSTLVNRLIGEERVLAYDSPGTTRDSIYVPFERNGEPYVLIDTAGIRRRARVEDMVEKISVIKALQAIEQADVVIALVDARADIGTHDAHLLGLIAERGRAMVIGVNKWDGLEPSERRRVQTDIDRQLPFLDYAPLHFISALHGGGLGELFEAVNEAYRSSVAELPTPELTRVLEDAVEAHSPPAITGRRIKLRYAHQGGRNPPKIIIHGNQTDRLPVAYHRYLIHQFRKAFKLVGTPLRLEFRTGENPFKGRKNVLTTRQTKKRKRLMRHAKR